MKKYAIWLLCLATLLGISLNAFCQGTLILDPDNGHYYEAISEGTIWSIANESAAGMTYDGFQGHLATISSQQENDFVYNSVYLPVFTNYPGFTGKGDWVWLGGYQPQGSIEPAGGWTWVTIESFDYTNWDSGQPSNSEGVPQDFLVMWHGGLWNDAAGPNFGGYAPAGFIVEFEPVPEPCTLALLGISGLAGLLVTNCQRLRF